MEYALFMAVLIFLLVILIFMPFGQLTRRKNFKNMIEHIKEDEVKEPTLTAVGIFEKVVHYSSKFYRLVKPITKREDYEKNKKSLLISGLSDRISTEGLISSKFFLAFVGGVYVLFLSMIQGAFFILVPVFLFMGYLLPGFFIKNQIQLRKMQIERELPSVLNTMAVMTEAGMGLFDAIEKVSEVRKGVFISELKTVWEEVKLGLSRKEAFQRMADRCEVQDVSSFVSALNQVMTKGAGGISLFIKDQANEIWRKRLNNAKEKGAKASLKLFFPMMLLIMPASMIFLVGPIIVNIIQGS